MNIRFPASFLLVGVCVGGTLAAEATPEQVAKVKANEAAQATVKGDFGKLADLTYPKIVEQMGGREKMVAKLEAGLKEMTSKGCSFRSAKVGTPSKLVAGGPNLFVVFPLTIEMKVPGGTLTVPSCLLGISGDKGKTWTFFNGDKANDEKAKKFLPSLPAALELPKKKKAIFRKNE